jgi:hypothetical protein
VKISGRDGFNNPNFIDGKYIDYRKVCFKFHAKRCVVCSEEVIVDVHHYDGNRTNNEPANLIPLCPNHHRYWHSKYRSVVQEAIDEYRTRFIESQLEDVSVPLYEEEY